MNIRTIYLFILVLENTLPSNQITLSNDKLQLICCYHCFPLSNVILKDKKNILHPSLYVLQLSTKCFKLYLVFQYKGREREGAPY